MKFVSLFAGIGGIDLGLEAAGHECVGQVEIDPYCRRVLEKHWPDVPRHDDVKTFRGDEFGPFDMLVGGYPCQPFSVAGQRRGEDDDRHLWPEVHRIIRNVRPAYVLLENVTGHLALGFGRVLGDLAESGYDASWATISASALGAPHVRERLFVLAHPHGQRLQGWRSQWAGFGIEALPQAALRMDLPAERTNGMDDGLSAWMDGDLNAANQSRPDAAMPPLWEETVAQAIHNGAFGGPRQVPQAPVLQSGMCGRSEGDSRSGSQANDDESRAEIQERRLRAMWGYQAAPCAPRGSRPNEQQPREPDDSVRDVPQPPTRRSLERSRRKALGNAVVPQVAEYLGHLLNEAAA